MERPWLVGLVLLGILPLHEMAVLKVKEIIVVGKVKLKCSFTLVYSPESVDLKKSRIMCSPRNKKPLKIANYKIPIEDSCVFMLSMTITRGKGKLSSANIKCITPESTWQPTTTTSTTITTTTTTLPERETTVTMINCGPETCGIWCSEEESCQEDDTINCVKEPCCPRWNCKGTIQPPTPTPSPTNVPPTISPSSTCCKEKEFDDSNYILVGEDETLPTCGNECIYRKEDEGNKGQLYCFPKSFSDLENECDYKNTAPKPLVGFSPWTEWTECQGACDGQGRSTRERSCVADIADELSCSGPTKQFRNCESHCGDIRVFSNNCNPEIFHTNVMVPGYPCTYHFLPEKTWNNAQEKCRSEFGGKLWEPANPAEYNAVINAAEKQVGFGLGSCRWWLGLFNWNDGSPNSVDAYLSSTVTAPPTTAPDHNEPSPPNGVISTFITVNDGNDGGSENCVHTVTWNLWRDDRCTREKPFICQSCPPPCSCTFNNVSYPCGSIVERKPHCCSDMVCNKQGIIEENQLTDLNGKPESGCCIWRGRMYSDGTTFGPFWRRLVCCRGEVLSRGFKWIFFPIPSKPVGSLLTISEGGGTFVQENTFTNSTGILEIKVPAHKNYTNSVYLLHQASETIMLKTNNTCQISNLPPYINVSSMAKELQTLEDENSTVSETTTITTYLLKARQARYGVRKRQELLPEIQDHCQNEPMVETNDFSVNETEFEKYNAGELILVKNKKKTRTCETYYNICSKEGPMACGYAGWENPDENAPVAGFTFHQVSDGSICVNCNIELPGPPPCDNGFCECKDIQNKIDLMDCVLDPATQVSIVEGDEIISQQLTYNSQDQARSITISSPAHKDLQSLEIVMHAATNGYWHGHAKNNHMMKLGEDCFVSTLPRNIFPVDIALGLQEIKKGNNITEKADEIDTQGIIIGLNSLSNKELGALHPDIKSRCSDRKIKDFKEMPITKDQSEDLKNGKVILLNPTSTNTRTDCQLLTAASTNNNGSSCWRWPNPGTGQNVYIHHIVTSVITVTCCSNFVFPTCCQDLYPEYCICEDITQQNFETCIPPLRTSMYSEDLSENGTTISVLQEFIYNRENGGSMRIEVEAHKEYKQSTLIFNKTKMVLKNGDDPCTVLDGIPSASSPVDVAIAADEIKKAFGKEISLEDQTRQDYVLVKTAENPKVEGILDICQNYSAATVTPISSDQYEDLEAGNIIFVPMEAEVSRELNTCELKEACTTSNGSSCLRFPTPGGDTIYVHDVIASPTCLKCCDPMTGTDPNYCKCSDIKDSKSFEFCLGPRPDALFVVSGVDSNSESSSSVEVLTKDAEGNYVSRSQEGCYVDNFPIATSSATGALIYGQPHVCAGYTGDGPHDQCYQLEVNGKWNSSFTLNNSLYPWGSSLLFDLPYNGDTVPIWWLVGGDPEGTTTEIFTNVTGYIFTNATPGYTDIPKIINQPCLVNINDTTGFLSAIPKFEAALTNLAWIFNGVDASWTRLPDSLEKHSGPACGFLQNDNGSFIVLAGGYKSSTTEFLNLDTNQWFYGPPLPTDVYGGNMVSVMDGQELILTGGYDTQAMTQILRLDSSMTSWEPAGNLIKPRFNTVVMTVPIEKLPPKFEMLC